MPSPRIFVSSTCYDLQEIRVNLRTFIEDFGYDPIMSDFGDIFYDFYDHVQDSCIKAIQNSDMYILIIGDYYGSSYHKDTQKKIPDSVTLKEFKKAIDLEKPKAVFINKFVNYDYRNYKRYLKEQLKKYFSENTVNDEEIDIKKNEVKNKIDENYPFPKESYKYVFRFLDMISDLDNGGAYFTFETSEHIKNELKKQWAGFLQESLSKKYLDNIEHGELKKVETKIDSLNDLIGSLIQKTSSEESKLVIDVNDLLKDVNLEKLKELQDQLEVLLTEIFEAIDYEDAFDFSYNINIEFDFTSEFDKNKIQKWLDNLGVLLSQYKWSKTIDIDVLFDKSEFKYEVLQEKTCIPYEDILKLYSIYSNIAEGNDKDAFITTILKKFEDCKGEEFPF